MFLPVLPQHAGFEGLGVGRGTIFWRILKLSLKMCYFDVENLLYPAKLPYLMSLRNYGDFRYEGKPQADTVDLLIH
jgi:hypothetical protein